MKEIEILVEVFDDYDKTKTVLSKYDFISVKETIDEYFYNPLNELLKPDKDGKLYHCLRVRNKGEDSFVTYKDDIYENGIWKYSDEYETKVESSDVVKNMLKELGFKTLVVIDSKKEIYHYDKYEIVLETVKDLGLFLEVEYCTNEDIDIDECKKQIQRFIDKMNIRVSDELNMGKPEMYLKKHKIHV